MTPIITQLRPIIFLKAFTASAWVLLPKIFSANKTANPIIKLNNRKTTRNAPPHYWRRHKRTSKLHQYQWQSQRLLKYGLHEMSIVGSFCLRFHDVNDRNGCRTIVYCKGVITLNPCSGTRHHKNSLKTVPPAGL